MKRVFKRFLMIGAASSLIAVLLVPSIASAITYTITDYSTTSSNPTDVTAGPDGNVWYVSLASPKAGRVTPSGTITEFTISGASTGITTGPDGNLWYTDQTNGKIGKMNTSGTVLNTYTVSSAQSLEEITAGADGNLWFADGASSGTNRIGKITTSGTITMYSVPTVNSSVYFVTAGPDGNIWFTEPAVSKVAKITPSGTVTEYDVPGVAPLPNGLVAGPDGNIWVTLTGTNKIAKVTTAGVITLYSIPTSGSVAQSITAGADGNLWFQEYNGSKIGKITTGGVVSETAFAGTAHPYEIASGPDGNIWFSEYIEGKVGKLALTSDWDDDNFSNTTEAAAPNSGDANGDGIQDNWQANVTSMPDPVTGKYVSLQSSCSTNFNPMVGGESSTDADSTYDYPAGLLSFTAICGTPGSTVDVTEYYYGTFDASKFVLRSWNSGNHTYTTVPGATFTNVTVGGQAALKVTYTISDGGPFDRDGTVDGNIADPIGPALSTVVAAAPNTGLGTYTNNAPKAVELAVLSSTLIALGYVLHRKKLSVN